MNPVTFPEVTIVLAKDQPEYVPLPVCITTTECQGRSVQCAVSCWELNEAEVLELVKTRRIWVNQLTFGAPLQPQWLGVESPFVKAEENGLR